MTLSKNLILAVNKVVGFELFKTEETIDEATARIEAMQPMAKQMADNIEKLNTAITENEQLKEEVSGMQRQIADSESENKTIKSSIEDLKKDFSTQILDLKSAIINTSNDKKDDNGGNSIVFPETQEIKHEAIVSEK